MISDGLQKLYTCLLKYRWGVHQLFVNVDGHIHICLSKHKDGSIDKCVKLIPMEKT